MEAVAEAVGKVLRTIMVPLELDIEFKVFAAERGLRKNDLYLAGAYIVLAIITGGVPRETIQQLIEAVEALDPEAAEKLRVIAG